MNRNPIVIEYFFLYLMHPYLLNNGRHITLSRSPGIPACFWRESKKVALDTRLRGYDEKTFMQGLVPGASNLDVCPHLLRSYMHPC